MEKKVTGDDLARLTKGNEIRLNETLIAYVKEHQGEKGYIDTSKYKEGGRNILVYHYGDRIWDPPCACKIMGVRVKNNQLEIAAEPYSSSGPRIIYNEESFRDEENWDRVCRKSGYYDPRDVVAALGTGLKHYCNDKSEKVPLESSEKTSEKSSEEKSPEISEIVATTESIHRAVDEMNGYDKIDLIMYILNDREVYSWMEEYMKPL